MIKDTILCGKCKSMIEFNSEKETDGFIEIKCKECGNSGLVKIEILHNNACRRCNDRCPMCNGTGIV